jgi:hypothetical protein
MKTKFFTIIVLLALALTVFTPSRASFAAEACPIGLVKIEVVNEVTGEYIIEYGEAEIPAGFTFDINGATVTFSSKVDICVKAGNEYQMIYGVTEYTVDWLNQGGQIPDISHIVINAFYPPYEGQWCSPGYWRNHLDEVPVGLDTYFGGFTVLEILENPKIHARTGLYEGLADYLSGLHPGVDFLGTRVEDSCPLN